MKHHHKLPFITTLSLLFFCSLNAMDVNRIETFMEKLQECGICKIRAATAPWSNDYSEFAHKECVELIDDIEKQSVSGLPIAEDECQKQLKIIRSHVQKQCEKQNKTIKQCLAANYMDVSKFKENYRRQCYDVFRNYLKTRMILSMTEHPDPRLCGICFGYKADALWNHYYGKFAHKKCIDKVASIENHVASYFSFGDNEDYLKC